MPIITVQINKSEAAVKASLIKGLTAAAVEATKIPAQSFTVFIQEADSDSIGLGGKTLTEVKAGR